MGNQVVSNADNDYNPFNIPKITLKSPSEFSAAVAMRGCPSPYRGTQAEFANLPVETQAAYADGVVRGSYQQGWMKEQLHGDIPDNTNDSAVGGCAYAYLKTQDQDLLQRLIDWYVKNKNNFTKF